MSTAARPLRAVVTAGGTEESVDDVRTLTNVSSGRLGAALARALDRRGVDTTVIASRALAARPDELRGGVRTLSFRGFADLDRHLAALADDPPDIVLMAAAVSDFSPAPASGKITSDAATLDLHLVRNPKLLARLREALGPRVVLVGFKLLSGVTPEVLEQVARAQARAARLDLTVANDLRELVGDRHPVLLVPPDGDGTRIDAEREDVADALAEVVIALADARRTANVAAPVNTVVAVADQLGFHAGIRAVRVRADGASALLQALDGVDAVLAVDDALGRFDATVPMDQPPSDESLRRALADAARAGRWNGGPSAIAIEEGGVVLALDDRAALRLAAGFEDAPAALAAARPGLDVAANRARARPLLDGARVRGVVITTDDGIVAPFVTPACRGAGLGDEVARALAARGVAVAVEEADAAFFVERGFRRRPPLEAPDENDVAAVLSHAAAQERAVALGEGVVVLDPPDLTTAIAAASVALVDPLRRRVLLGRRQGAPYAGCWAFPGGAVAPGEDAHSAALRELAEETGIVLPAVLTPHLTTRVLAGDGHRVFTIDNLTFLVLRAEAPVATSELDARWVSLATAVTLRPMTAGTRLVLSRLGALLHATACPRPARG